MKKFIFTIVFMLGMSATALADSVIFLEHKGNMTTFKAENINDALEAAADGDVLYLSEGTYPGFTITKQISIKGVGQQTIVDGNIEINNSDKVKLTGIFIGYLDMNNLIVASPVSGLKVTQCHINNTSFLAITEQSQIDRCYFKSSGSYEGLRVGETYSETITIDGISNTYKYPYIKGLTVSNSVINRYYQKTAIYSNVSLINCFIYELNYDGYPYGITFINSIINRCAAGYVMSKCYFTKFKMVNTAFGFDNIVTEGCEITDCYDDVIEDYSVETLSAKGYLGNDGKVIGPYGGNTPYTLVPAVPRVTKSKIMVDPKKQELNAILTVSPK